MFEPESEYLYNKKIDELKIENDNLKTQLEVANSALLFAVDHSNDFYIVDKCKIALDRIAAMERKDNKK